ncbi:hypothetical protein FKW77_008813 [Venturia effusa]|uniref:Profilin n=1 Tax=Venturia effusa TaxID=50376 RepID=A0A517LJG1_9PEZI|nr:hypothetical protein FKW77_008813 [Venturia effusa]
MSWQAYIDTSLIGTGNVDSAAIFSVNGKDNWARSADFKVRLHDTEDGNTGKRSKEAEQQLTNSQISPEEMKVLLDGFADPNPLYGSGFHVDGVKYTVIGATDKTIRGKQGKNGMIVAKTTQALLLAHHNENVTTQNCVGTVEALQDYLVGVGY